MFVTEHFWATAYNLHVLVHRGFYSALVFKNQIKFTFSHLKNKKVEH